MNTAEYLIKKLEEFGISDIFGVAGDYNFNILSEIENNQNINWIGCTNELNAGYAADGYARQKGFGAIVTTYGVGELSAINAIAGSYAENVPVIHIVGTPSINKFKGEKTLHHSLNNKDYKIFFETQKNIVETSAFLTTDNAKLEIDRVLKTFYKERKPVYIAIPEDIATLEITYRDVDYDWVSDSENLEEVIKLASEKINNALKPVIIADTLIKRFSAKQKFIDFVAQSNLPVTNFLMGKGIVNSDCKNYIGDFLTKYGNPDVDKIVKETDCLISVGVIYGDDNSYNANLPFKINSHIAIYGTYTYIDGKRYENVKMTDVLSGITKYIKQRNFDINIDKTGYQLCKPQKESLNSNYIYSRLQEFIKGEDIIIAESGLIPHGISRMYLPENIEIHSSLLWCSIGWATAATLGVCIANPKARVILITGDGAHQISAMEIGNMFRYGVKPIIVVINNQGYGVERLLSKTPDAKFNNIMQIDFPKFVRSFNGDVWSTSAKTEDDFDKALRVTQIMDKLCYIEAVTDKTDIPDSAKMLTKINLVKNSVQKENEWAKTSISTIKYETNVHTSMKYCEEIENE